MDKTDFDARVESTAESWAEMDSRLTRWHVQSPMAIAPAERELRRSARYIIAALSLNLKLSNKKIGVTLVDDAEQLLEKGNLSLLNARHDATDAILAHMSEFLANCEKRSPLPEFIMQYPRYYDLKDRIINCASVLSDTRKMISSRAKIYETKIEPEIEFFTSEYPLLIAALERAVQSRQATESRILVSRRWFGFLNVFAIITGIASLIGVPLAIWLWVNSPAVFCEETSSFVYGFFCG